MDIESILKKALEMELEDIDEYAKMKENADAETAELLDFLINEEKKHAKMIEKRLRAIKLLKRE